MYSPRAKNDLYILKCDQDYMCPAKPKIFITCPLYSLLTPAVRDYRRRSVGLGKPWRWPAGEGHETAVGRSSVDKGCWHMSAAHQILVD